MKNSAVTHIALALLRIVPSALMLTHGIPKFQKLISGNIEFINPLGIGEAPTLFLAVLGEFVAPILVIIGLKTKWATIPTILTMAAAAFIVHAPDPIGKRELALLYLTIFVLIFLLGPGKYSIDKK
ncbi:DoxX family protein [Allomuricauda sp. SCSIO 65647]|uniref:DoxX family protein n=1 Tax=Allomuricauda sp. SCSIO 65647 TaxID=2908843 RepID=UPI001F2FF750|nr:DoxX family protein [Muricauda sp. SCSIO 65647]UJH67452.1 DoxX family protein [Muricauda sp. SCSIO 65647]